MWKEVLWLQPKLNAAEMSGLERALNSRFARVAKKFGKGITAVFTGGGIAALGLSLVDKLLNPLKETQEAIDRTLKSSDDIVTNAKQFGTTAGKLFRLQQLAKSTGLDENSLDVLLTKFQGAVAEAEADKTKETSVRNFVGEKDMAEAFFEFIQSLQKMERNEQVRVQQEVFGEKQVLKMADFLQTDFRDQTRRLGGPTASQLTPGLEKLAGLNDEKDILSARMTVADTFKKAQLINADMVKMQAEAEQRALNKENANIQGYKDLANISAGADQILKLLNDGLLKLAEIGSSATTMAKTASEMSASRIMRGIINKMYGGKF